MIYLEEYNIIGNEIHFRLSEHFFVDLYFRDKKLVKQDSNFFYCNYDISNFSLNNLSARKKLKGDMDFGCSFKS